MNTEYYKNLAMIIECGSISSAARQLHIAQSALSKQVQQLESEFCTQLLIRKARLVEPTSSGLALYEYAKTLDTLESAVKQEIRDISLGARGTLKIGMAPSTPDSYIEKLCFKFHQIAPLVNFEFYEAHSLEVINILRTGVVEIGYIRLPQTFYPNIVRISEATTYPIVVFPRDNPWGQPDDGGTITPKDLHDVPLSITRGFQQSLERVFRDAGVPPRFFSISSSRTGSLQWVKCGVAAAIVIMEDPSDAQTDETFGKLLELPGEQQFIKRSFVVLNNRPLSHTAQRFISFIQAAKAT
jgi:DNA-binding transcriptional LysR family regulator